MSGSDGRARMGNLVLEKEKADWCFSVKRGRQLFRNRRSSGICSECRNGERIPMKAMRVEKAVEFLGGAIHDAVEEGTGQK